ncbi:spore germination protein GerPC [Paenibacillus sp. MMS18-CY102]|uniref:spore germination protein GerPC n=1 Tax=Paenibacillus sp. MMS18-CY102 TaxID=2682849 RepID=UPI0013667867|nr:spore germination protein GerPC [Paenibacillus sp. MMS18-CY102]MWC29251.1 hypothetical protein [Paenibacillus sp. MMS18-CY102]
MTIPDNGYPPRQPQPAISPDQQQPASWPGWPSWVQQVQLMFKQQQEQIAMLNARMEAMHAQLRAVEGKPTYNIEKLEYHFDQLKVEKLDGTLNIGIQPPSDGSDSDIDQLIVQQAKKGIASGQAGNDGNGEGPSQKTPNVFPTAPPGVMKPPPPFPAIQSRVNDYLDQTAPIRLSALEMEQDLPLDPYHRRIVIEDIRKQMPQRIQYYMQQVTKGQDDNEQDGNAIEEQVTTKAIRDIEMAFRQYLMKLSGGGPQAGGVNTV